MTCQAVRQADEMHCATCGLRWNASDDAPPAALCQPQPEPKDTDDGDE